MKNLFVFVFIMALVASAIITSAAIYEHKIVFYSIIGVVSLHYIVYNTIWWGKDELDDYVDSHLFMTLLRHLLVVVLLNGFVLLVLQLNQ